ncbi:MAG: hypothetical protein ABI400_14200 [Lacisediminihabitans sp.]
MSAAIIEIRRYIAHPGKRAELVAYMDEVVIPFVRERGVEVSASLVDQADEDAYIWIRSFENEADKQSKYEAIYQNPEWIATISPVVASLMDFDTAVITTASPTVAAG